MNKKILNIAVIIFSIIMAIIIISPFILSPFEEPNNRFFPVNYKSTGKEKIILISWAGCPIGASLSWPLYLSLKNHGNITYYPWHSDPGDSFPCTPGLIFTNYTSNTINASFIYLYNENLTGNFENKSISGNLINYGLNELKSDLSPGLYHIAKKYTTQEWIAGSYFGTSSEEVSPHHINTIIIISGENGTELLNGYLYNPSNIKNYSDNQLLENGSNVSYIHHACEVINNYINIAG